MPILIVALVIGIIMATTAILPLASDYSEAKTFKNEGYFYVDSVTGEESINYHYENGVFSINGVEVPAPSSSTYPDGLTVFFTEHITVRMDQGTIRIKGQVNQACSAIDLTATEGTITGTYTYGSGPTTSTANWTYTKFVGMVTTDTDRVMSQPVPQYVHKDSIIDTTGFTRVPNINEYYVISVYGSIDSGIEVNLYTQGAGSAVTLVTVSDITVNYTEVKGYDDLYKVDNITFTLTKDDKTDNVTYSIYTVPAEVTAIPDNPDTYKNLIKIVPLMAFIMLVVAAAAMIISKRD